MEFVKLLKLITVVLPIVLPQQLLLLLRLLQLLPQRLLLEILSNAKSGRLALLDLGVTMGDLVINPMGA